MTIPRFLHLVTAVGLMLLLAACQDPPPAYTFEGTTTRTTGIEQPITLTFQQRGERLVGEYQIRAATGRFLGTQRNGNLTAELSPSPTCTYTFEGALDGATLTGEYEPTDCPGGEGGTWTLERR